MQKDSKKAKIEPVHIEEAAKLKALFNERAKVSQMRFGEDNELGSQGNVWQYLNARSPLNLEAAIKFAKGLKCSVSDFSPRLASALRADSGPHSTGAELAAAVSLIASGPALGAAPSSIAHPIAASATTSAIDLATQAAEIGRMWLLLPEARRKKVKAALERELSHSKGEHSDDEAAGNMQQNVARQPHGFGRELDPTAGASGEKKSPAGKAGEGQ